MNALSLYNDLKERGVILEAQGEYLKLDAPVGVVTEEDKTALLAFITHRAKESQLAQTLKATEALEEVREVLSVMRVEGK